MFDNLGSFWIELSKIVGMEIILVLRCEGRSWPK